MIGGSKEVDRDLSTVSTASCNCVCVLGRYSTTRCSAGRITTAINPQNTAFGIRLFYFIALEKLTIEKEIFLSLPHFLGAQIVFCLRGPLAIGQAGNLASPPPISVEKKYTIVCFVHESQVEVVPSSWLVNNSTVKWPNNCTITAIMKCIRECKSPEDSLEYYLC
ncbi:hypothetical protein AVEN_162872-1 [Araneus ventricosus]|uniref:Uncharacterized protein n=1 Tax=Araneus ventricosus TaxID=182803 RepID=A0A4Y2THE1_ARAVE|nr:hypothetical protein AVEN_162872-1 [Araneus ventricosus]